MGRWDVCLSVPSPFHLPTKAEDCYTLGGSENTIPLFLIEPNLETNAKHSERQNRGEKESMRGSEIGNQHRRENKNRKKKAVLYNLIFYFNKGIYYRINVAKNLG